MVQYLHFRILEFPLIDVFVVKKSWALGPCSGGCRLENLAQGEGMVFGILCLEMIFLAPISKIDVLSWNMVLHQIFGALF